METANALAYFSSGDADEENRFNDVETWTAGRRQPRPVFLRRLVQDFFPPVATLKTVFFVTDVRAK
jgi:hypothetical protein